MYRKLLAVMLAIALVGTVVGGVTASDGASGVTVADSGDVTTEDSNLDGGAGGGGTCSLDDPVSTQDSNLDGGAGGC